MSEFTEDIWGSDEFEDRTYDCKFCTVKGLYWREVDSKWHLYTKDGKRHSCPHKTIYDKSLTKKEESVIIKENKSPFGEARQTTHYKDCWKEHGLCAIKKLTEIQLLLSMAKSTVKTKEIMRIFE